MRRWIPSPWLSVCLFAMWLLLNGTVAPAHLLLGAVAALGIPLLTIQLRPAGPPLRRPIVLARLVAAVGLDVVSSALDVATGVLRSGRRTPRGRFVRVPLTLRNPHALAALAVITAVVPGTVWTELASDRSAVLLHVFDVDDEATFIAHYKSRYERPLEEIF